MPRYDFHEKDENVNIATDCGRVFYVPGVTPAEMRCHGEIVGDGWGANSLICESSDCPLVLGKLAMRAERYGEY